jgi:dolichol-phosphate mannosyltransferase
MQGKETIMNERIRSPRVSAVIPCYNEEECIDELYRRVSAACREAAGDDYEIVLVNDGSRDRTWAAMQGFAASDEHVVAVDLSRNHGHQVALTAGLSLTRGALIFVLDADLQDPPELLGPMIATMEAEKADVVYGRRRERAGETWFKKACAASFYRLLSRVADVDVALDTGDFRLMTRRALDVILAMPEQFRFVRGMVAWIGFKQVPHFFDRAERFAGVTKYPLMKLVRMAIDAITGFSISPLRLASHLGLALAVLSIPLFLYIVGGWLLGKAVPGWTSLILVVTIIGSVQMIMLGLLGEYVGRIYMQSKGRPVFIVREVLSHAVANDGARRIPLGYVDAGAWTTPAEVRTITGTRR